MERKAFDCVVIGGGPGGYVAAIRAAQRGLTTALIEAREMGGTCLNRGCIPSKALIANAEILRKVREADAYGISTGSVSFNYTEMAKRKDQVVQKIRKGLESLIAANKITVFNGFGRFLSSHEIAITGKDEAILEAATIIIATGSEPRNMPAFLFDYKRIHDSTSLLEITDLPKKLVIVGGGVIGCEFASLHRAFDVDVTIIELLPTILSTEGTAVADFLAASLRKQGIRIETNAIVEKIQVKDKGVVVQLADKRLFEADMALVAVGRKFNTDKIGLEKTGVVVETNGTISTNEYMQTNVPHIFAIGDVTGKWILAHVASHQGLVAADNVAGVPSRMYYNSVPSVIFTHPEAGSVGYTLERAIQAGFDAVIGKFPFQALGKSQASIETEGFAQIVVERKTGQILGAQVVGHQASALIAEMAVAISNELTVQSVNETIHAHPTIAEAWMEAAFLAEGLPLHFPPKVKGSG